MLASGAARSSRKPPQFIFRAAIPRVGRAPRQAPKIIGWAVKPAVRLAIYRPLSVKARSFAIAISFPDPLQVDRPQLLPISQPLMDAETGLFTKLSPQARCFTFLPQKEYKNLGFFSQNEVYKSCECVHR
ncbi:hypothetical protein QUB56_30680 [Microcoleus sp. AR_TQ3_B6]|uniref:hypothetical protein n=1 Tax=Microcoleus sp. AR_TQ3_B6 TaxID=3055284 RepID=UPI002FD46888